jgi:hypothetical protein
VGGANRDDPAGAGHLRVTMGGDSPRGVSKRLSAYLCGTHSGLLGITRGRSQADPNAIAAAHRALNPPEAAGPSSELGKSTWTPREGWIAERLRRCLNHDALVELILFGSQARGGVTGFSDVDAILVIGDEAAEDPKVLRSIRPRVLAAQRAVLAYQPMQHHGFELATPKLLRIASEALALPAPALGETSSLHGRPMPAALSNGSGRRREPVEALLRQLLSVRSWPEHVWKAHGLIAMFELVPVLYLQSRGRSIPKWASFDEARKEFPNAWWPYEVLSEVRLNWPRTRRRSLELATGMTRNPWAAIALWRSLPGPLPEEVRPLLTNRTLERLQFLARAMADRAGWML